MLHEQEGARLLSLLWQRWGDDPGWTLHPNKDYGFYLLYRQDTVPISEVRRLIVETFGFAIGPTFIKGDLSNNRL
jgi:hypothetical protein